MGEYTRIYVDEAKKATKFCKQEIREFLHGEKIRQTGPPHSLQVLHRERSSVISFLCPPTHYLYLKLYMSVYLVTLWSVPYVLLSQTGLS
jgi:hypothetical protein